MARDPELSYVDVDPVFDPVRNDTRFSAIDCAETGLLVRYLQDLAILDFGRVAELGFVCLKDLHIQSLKVCCLIAPCRSSFRAQRVSPPVPMPDQ
jgi:hypothetical protein